MIASKKARRIAIVAIFGDIILCVSLFVLYGPWSYFRNLWITTAMTTMSHNYLAHIFYSEETISEVMSNNFVIIPGEDTDVSLIEKNNGESNYYTDIYEKQILEKDEGNDLYKVINIQGSGYKGFLVAIYDPSKIKLVMADKPESSGETLTTIAKRYNAKVAINASGFDDLVDGGTPNGSVVKDGKIVFSNGRMDINGGVIGFDYNNNLVLTNDSIETALAKYNLRDAVEFGPFLIVNGKASFIKGNGGWGIAPRTAIGQRSDGIVLLLVIDGRRIGYSLGADMVELTKIMTNYKAVNAANLDGGLSTTLAIEKVLRNRPAIISSEQRALPNAWVVVD